MANAERETRTDTNTARTGDILGALRSLHDRFVERFVVSSSSGGSLAYLDGIRAIAVILVVVFHVWTLSGTPRFSVTTPLTHSGHDLTIFLATGFVGVELFFVLSGFLLSQPWFRADYQGNPRPNTRTYFRRRLLRIIPGYYAFLFLTIALLCPFIIPSNHVYSLTGAGEIGADLLFAQYVIPSAAAHLFNIHGHIWTLTMEMIFYLILPWVVLLFLRRRWMIALPISALISLGWLSFATNSFGPLVRFVEMQANFKEPDARYFLTQQFPAHWVSFALGITLANLTYQYRSGRPMHRVLRLLASRWAGLVYFLVGSYIVLWGMNHLGFGGATYVKYWWGLTVSIGFTLMIGGIIIGGRWLQAIFGFLPLRLIGVIGYSAFLWHLPLIYLINKYPEIAPLSPEAHFFFVLIRVAIALTLVSCFAYLAIEKPFLLMSRRLDAAARHAASAPEAQPAPPPTAVPIQSAVNAGDD